MTRSGWCPSDMPHASAHNVCDMRMRDGLIAPCDCDQHDWWGCITTHSGKRLDFYMRDFRITEGDDKWPIEPDDGGELLYACKTRWAVKGIEHQCEIEKSHKRHRCECGSSRSA